MKTCFLCCALLLLYGCTKTAAVLPPAPAPAAEGFVQYRIGQGQHYAGGNVFRPVETAALHFVVRFDSTAVYRTAAAENQYDINKLYGFSDNNTDHHQFSARFGWRWSDGALRLFAYVYNNGQVSARELGPVTIGTAVACSIGVSGDSYVFTWGDRRQAMPRRSTTALAKGYLLYPYFGGDEPAPHAISIWIQEG